MKWNRLFGLTSISIGVLCFIFNLNLTGGVIGIKDNSILFNIFLGILFFGGIFLTIRGSVDRRVVSGGLELISLVKKDPQILKHAREVEEKPEISREINHLLGELKKGNISPGYGSRRVSSNGLIEARGKLGGRIFYIVNDKSKTATIFGYAYKDAHQQQVIDRINNVYGEDLSRYS